MIISEVHSETQLNGLQPFKMQHLGNVVVLAGRNGSGKSRLLKLLTQRLEVQEKIRTGQPLVPDETQIADKLHLQVKDSLEGMLARKYDGDIRLLNYSHYDLPLQLPNDFPPYVIKEAKKNLTRCDFEETAQDALLYFKYLIQYFHPDGETGRDELKEINEILKDLLDVELCECHEAGRECEPSLFGLPVDRMSLSPGQKYLLRMCVALYCNQVEENSILFLDEPETHLHPNALWMLIQKLKDKFHIGQIWIATHSVALLSIFNASSIWHMEQGKPQKLGSKSIPLFESLLGGEDKRFLLRQFIAAPDAFACNEFAYECMFQPKPANYKKADPQVDSVTKIISEWTSSRKAVVVDFGVGQGRFLDGVGSSYPERLDSMEYYAYDIDDVDPKDETECKAVMLRCGIDTGHYSHSVETLKSKLSVFGGATHVLMVNVLHEIPSDAWVQVFSNVSSMLADSGVLILAEAEILHYGERPYDNGFLVIQQSAVEALLDGGEFECRRNDKPYEYVAAYTIPKASLNAVKEDTVKQALEAIKTFSLKQIETIKKANRPLKQTHRAEVDRSAWKTGLELAFWTHQFANAELALQ